MGKHGDVRGRGRRTSAQRVAQGVLLRDVACCPTHEVHVTDPRQDEGIEDPKNVVMGGKRPTGYPLL
jgi:hypothetical protein